MIEAPPEQWKLTPLSRSLVDLDHMLDSDSHASFFRSVETLSGLYEEQKRIAARINTLYLLTFLGALVVLSGPLPEGAKLSLMGVEASVKIIPQQIVSVLMAVAYSMFATLFISMLILAQMIDRILKKETQDSWGFIGARFDASTLYAVLIQPKTVGYQSPRRHLVMGFGLAIVAVLSVCAHSFVVVTAAIVALISAWHSGIWYLVVFAGMAAIICLVSIVSLISMIAMPLPFRLSKHAQ
jgi:hypothetical protein